MYNLNYNKSLVRKVFSSFCLEYSSFSNNLWFFSFHIIQKNAWGSCLPHFHSFFSPQRSHIILVSLWLWKISPKTHQTKKTTTMKVPCFGIIKDDVMNGFFLIFTKKICLPMTILSSKIDLTSIFFPIRLLSKKTCFIWNQRIPNYSHWKRNRSRWLQDRVKSFDGTSFIHRLHPNHHILSFPIHHLSL